MAGRKKSAGAKKKVTPVMAQHAAAKAAYPDAVLFFRLGDFYEMFGDDAVLVARELDLTLTARNKGKPDEYPMAGVPHHAAHGYVGRLLSKGYKVAICEQMADPATVKGIVPREVVRVVTPGLVTDTEQLEARSNHWLAAVELEESGVGLALLDLSTGELRAAHLDDVAALLGELTRAQPREVLLGGDGEGVDRAGARTVVSVGLSGVPMRDDGELDGEATGAALAGLEADAAALDAGAVRAVARAIRYARDCNPKAELPIRSIARWDPRDGLVIDATAQQHLELVASNQGTREGSLLDVIDATRTAAGGRLLRRRLLAPLTNVERIRRRLDQVELFVINPRVRDDLRAALKDVCDIERIAVRASLREANPRDLGRLRDGLLAAARAGAVLQGLDDASREVLGIAGTVDVLPELASELAKALLERPSPQAKEGEVFASGWDPELDELSELQQSGADRMVQLEARLREETSIPTLKVRYTRVFGWYIEVTRTHTARVPSSFHRKQTIANGERYTTPELDELATKIIGAGERHRARELELLGELVRRTGETAPRLEALARELSAWDVASALADVAHRYDYARPTVDRGDVLAVSEGRHPVVERLAAAGAFVPNDVMLDLTGERFWLVTGPNMAGKSTLLRQTALTVILAQMGSYVPARAATVGVVDRVLSRVGASDNLARGESTFMVEMRETAEILRSATPRSLVILDEIGRGTSTYDGLSIAWAVAEHLDEVVRCRALFATHYHELTAFAEASPSAANHSVSAREMGDDVVFLHRLVPGPASRSYGVAVARLAGLPESVLARSKALLDELEGAPAPPQGPAKPRRRRTSDGQLPLFGAGASPDDGGPTAALTELERTLRAVDPHRLSPLDALQLVAKLKRRLEG